MSGRDGLRGGIKLTKIYEDDKQFEERTNKLHYPLLKEYFARDPNNPVEVVEIQDRTLQFKGIDLELHSRDGGTLQVELKTDRHVLSPNLFLEDVSNSQTGTLGWTLKCEADVLSYGFLNERLPTILTRQYLYDMMSLRQWYKTHREAYRQCQIPNKGYFTIGRPVPITDLEFFLIIKQEIS